ncbi:hypothetical protein ACHQM5_009069 [Ranunculus cassubicifolius]
MEANKTQSSKKRKREEDRLSILPQPVLHHILSFLDMRFVVQSSLLSKTWRTIWTTVPFLNFDYHVCDDECKFINFVDKTLLFRESSSIQIFHLNCGPRYLGFDFRPQWIDLVVRRKVQVLDLEFMPDGSFVNLPHYLFTCKSLVKLKIVYTSGLCARQFSVFSLPYLVNLPNIKTLHFNSLLFNGTVFFQQLFLGCPSLETLIMINCGLHNVDTVTISATQLKHLEIDNFYSEIQTWGQTDRSKCEITISTPNLTSLVCTFDILNKCSPEGLTSLVKGDIVIELPYYHRESIEELKLSSSWKKEFRIYMTKILQGLANAKSLNLSALLLETQVDPAKIWEYWQTDLALDSNLCHLKFVEIRNIRGCVNELEFLKLLLKNAISLEKMTIFTSQEHYPCRRQLKKFSDALLSFARASSNIAILFF